MTDVELVVRKLARLRDFVARAERRRPADAAALLADVDLADALCLAVLVATQEAVDIAMHIATTEGWALPDSQRDAFEKLATQSVIDPTLVARLAGVITVRNRIAHGYGTIDHERLWRDLPAGTEALRQFATAIAVWLGRA